MIVLLYLGKVSKDCSVLKTRDLKGSRVQYQDLVLMRYVARHNYCKM